jgi:UDP-N-acetylmuramate-alanine ligase
VIRDGDVIVTMGAGHISAVAHELPARLAVPAATGGGP